MQRKRQAAQDKGNGNQGDVQREKKLCFSKILPRSKIYDTAFVITANLAFVYYCLCWSRSLAQIYCTSVQYWRAWEATLSGDRIRRRLLYCSKASTHTENIHTTKLRRHRLLCQFKVYARRPSTLSGVVANGQVRSGLGELIAGLNKPRNLSNRHRFSFIA